MKTTDGVSLNLSPATAWVLITLLREWRNNRTPTAEYVETRYGAHNAPFKEFKRRALEDRLAAVNAVLEQLEANV